MMGDLVSIIVPAYNAERSLKIYLESIRQQMYPNIEVIVIDDGSTDRTAEIAAKFENVKLVRNEKNVGMQGSRNIGFKVSKGHYVWFMDSDMELTPNIVEMCVKTIQEKDLDAIMISERSKGDWVWAKCRGLEKIINEDDIYKNSIRFMKREVFENVGGYDPRFSAEDMDFHIRATRLGYKYELLRGYHIYHYEVYTIGKMLKKYYNYGKTMLPYARLYPKEAVKQFSFFRSAYVRNYKLFLRHPFLGSGLLFFKSLQYLAASLGILTYLFSKKNNNYNKNHAEIFQK